MKTKVGKRKNGKFLFESDGGISLSPTSVDTQIDSLLIAFEDDALEERDDIMPEGISIRNALKKLLLEEKDDEDEAEEVDPEDKPKADEPSKGLTPKINIEIFTSKVAMLIETYTKRLDVETVIFNRAKKYLIQGQGDAAADEFEELLSSQHDIDLRAKVDTDDTPSAPPAKGAGPSL